MAGTNDSGFSQSALLVIVVSGILISALVFTLKRRAYSRWSRTEGRVTKLTPAKDRDENTSGTWEALVEFETNDGKRIQFINPVRSNPPVAHVGDSVPVLYKATDPQNAIVDKFFHRHLFETVIFIFGSIGLIIFLSRVR